MQKYIKNVKGYNGKTYTIKKYINGSHSHHFNKRRLKKVANINHILSNKFNMFNSDIDKSLPSDVSPAFNVYKSKHWLGHIATNPAYDAWRCNSLGRSFKKQKDNENKKWRTMTKLNNEQNDKVANSWINEYDDMLPDYVNATIINPTVNTVSQFINVMFGKYNTLVHVKDKNDKPLQFWHFTELNGSHHCPDDNARWFSQSRSLRCGYSADNIKWGIRNNSLKHIKLSEELLPPVNKDIKTAFVVWGENGTNKKDVINYLAKKYNVKYLTSTGNINKLKGYINYFVKRSRLPGITNKVNINFVSVIASPTQTKILENKYQRKIIDGKQVRIIPIKLVMPNQRTVFKRLLKKMRKNTNQKYISSIRYVKLLIKQNYELEKKDLQASSIILGGHYVKHGATILSNNKRRMYQGLDWLMNNKRFEVEKDSYCEDTDKISDNFRENYENGLMKILSVY